MDVFERVAQERARVNQKPGSEGWPLEIEVQRRVVREIISRQRVGDELTVNGVACKLVPVDPTNDMVYAFRDSIIVTDEWRNEWSPDNPEETIRAVIASVKSW